MCVSVCMGCCSQMHWSVCPTDFLSVWVFILHISVCQAVFLFLSVCLYGCSHCIYLFAKLTFVFVRLYVRIRVLHMSAKLSCFVRLYIWVFTRQIVSVCLKVFLFVRLFVRTFILHIFVCQNLFCPFVWYENKYSLNVPFYHVITCTFKECWIFKVISYSIKFNDYIKYKITKLKFQSIF